MSNFGRTTTTTGGVRPHCVRVRCGVRAALGKLRLRARKRALAFDVSPTPQKHGGKMFRDTFSKVHSSLKWCFARSLLDTIWGYFQLINSEANPTDIVSREDHAKYFFLSEWTLANSGFPFTVSD